MVEAASGVAAVLLSVAEGVGDDRGVDVPVAVDVGDLCPPDDLLVEVTGWSEVIWTATV